MSMWHRVGKEHGRAVLSGGKAKLPGKGIWVAALSSTDNGQTTEEAIARDGEIIWRRMCHCGYDRHIAWKKAEEALFNSQKEWGITRTQNT